MLSVTNLLLNIYRYLKAFSLKMTTYCNPQPPTHPNPTPIRNKLSKPPSKLRFRKKIFL